MTQAELANTRRVDQLATTREVVQPCGSGGVRALSGPLRQVANPGLHFRQQAVDQRRLADPGLTDEDADMAIQASLQLLHSIAMMGRYFQ
ncbi:hypothetical protein D3C77_518100 [compost metagenome]